MKILSSQIAHFDMNSNPIEEKRINGTLTRSQVNFDSKFESHGKRNEQKMVACNGGANDGHEMKTQRHKYSLYLEVAGFGLE